MLLKFSLNNSVCNIFYLNYSENRTSLLSNTNTTHEFIFNTVSKKTLADQQYRQGRHGRK